MPVCWVLFTLNSSSCVYAMQILKQLSLSIEKVFWFSIKYVVGCFFIITNETEQEYQNFYPHNFSRLTIFFLLNRTFIRLNEYFFTTFFIIYLCLRVRSFLATFHSQEIKFSKLSSLSGLFQLNLTLKRIQIFLERLRVVSETFFNNLLFHSSIIKLHFSGRLSSFFSFIFWT